MSSCMRSTALQVDRVGVTVDDTPGLQGVHAHGLSKHLAYASVPVSVAIAALAKAQELKSLQNKARIVERFNFSYHIL